MSKTGRGRIFIGSLMGILLGIGGMLVVHRVMNRGLPEAEFNIRSGPGAYRQVFLHIQKPPEELLEEVKGIWAPLIAGAASPTNAVTNVIECVIYREEDGKNWASDLPRYRVFKETGPGGEKVLIQMKNLKGAKWGTVVAVDPAKSVEDKFLLHVAERYRDEISKVWKMLDPNK